MIINVHFKVDIYKPQPFVKTIYQGWRVTFLFMRYNEFFANWKRTKTESLLRKMDFLLI